MQDHLHTGFVQLAITTAFVIVAIHALRFGATWLTSQDNDLAQSSGRIIGSLVTFSNGN